MKTMNIKELIIILEDSDGLLLDHDNPCKFGLLQDIDEDAPFLSINLSDRVSLDFFSGDQPTNIEIDKDSGFSLVDVNMDRYYIQILSVKTI